MAITITPKEHKRKVGGHSYISIYGDLRDDIREIAAKTGRTNQEVAYSLLQQAVAEVLPQLEDDPPRKRRNK